MELQLLLDLELLLRMGKLSGTERMSHIQVEGG